MTEELLIDGSIYRGTSRVDDFAMIEPPVYFGPDVYVDSFSSIGRYTILNRWTAIRGAEMGRFCSIGEGVLIGAGQHPTQYLSTHPFHSSTSHFQLIPEYLDVDRSEPYHGWLYKTYVGSDVWIGSHAIIRSGVSLGHGSVVGAGSIVTKNVPPYAIVVGNPATLLRYRFSEDIVSGLLETKWWELDLPVIKSLPFHDVERCIDALRKIREPSATPA